MKKSPGRPKNSEAIIKDVKRVTRRQFNPEEKIAIVLEGLSGEQDLNLRPRDYESPVLTAELWALGGCKNKECRVGGPTLN